MSKTVHPNPPKFAENIFDIFFTPKYEITKIFSPPNSIGNFRAQFQVKMTIWKIKKMLSLKFWYLEKSTQKYVFDVKFFAEYDPGVGKN